MEQERYKVGQVGPDLGLKLNRNKLLLDNAITTLEAGPSALGTPYGSFTKTTSTAQNTPLAATQGVPTPVIVTTTAGLLNLVTMPSGGMLKSTSTRSFIANIDASIVGNTNSSAAKFLHWIYKNGSVIHATNTSSQKAIGAGIYTAEDYTLIEQVQIDLDDEFNIWVEDDSDPLSWDTYAATMRITFVGWV